MNCPTCNRSSKECRFIGEFCEFCATDIAKRQAPSIAEMQQCRWCGRLWLKGKYIEMDNDSIGRSIESTMKMPGWKAEVLSVANRDALVRFYYGAEKGVFFEKKLHLKITRRTCDECFKKSSGYYEAIVQLRGDPKKVDKEAGSIDRWLQNRNAFVTKSDRIEGGYDVYVSSKNLISEYFMQRKMKPKKSWTLYGIKEGKSVYRNTYLVRL